MNCNGNGSGVQAQLVSTGKFVDSDFTILNNPIPLTSAMLAPYDAVLVWTNNGFSYPVEIGDTLKKYVDNGGGVILATFSLSTPWAVGGGIMGVGYSPFGPSGTQCVSGTINLSTLTKPNHPIFKGITINPTYSANCNYSNPSLTAGATLLVSDFSGNKVVAENAKGNVVGIVIYPDNSTANASTKLMFANALYYVHNRIGWLTGSPLAADTVLPADSSTINLKFKSCGFTVGTYTANITVASNDPLKSLYLLLSALLVQVLLL